MKIGLDIGSTTIKCVCIDEKNNVVFESYERHYSQIVFKTLELIEKIKEKFNINKPVSLSISGSAGMGLADGCHVPFIQEVYATRVAANSLHDKVDVIVELGGEDAKILFLTNGVEVRMNGSCAGGTGAFIDQMATLLNVNHEEMNLLASKHEKIYNIASRCGVFAKSDIQPLLNQGANKADVCASIFKAVVNQTIAGLAQGRPMKGNVLYLGGPLTFLSSLRDSFDESLDIKGICPKNSLYYVALGAAFANSDLVDLNETINYLKNFVFKQRKSCINPLFKDKNEFDEFLKRHNKAVVEHGDISKYKGNVFLGIDAGSTTIKLAFIDEEGRLLRSHYQTNGGNPIPVIKDFLIETYQKYPNLKIASSAVTGYGEELVKNAFNVNYGVVETVAHYTAAHHFMPNVDFIIDIGGQDIKCFKIRNGAIDSIFLNEACSSGCGSFLQTFANALGYEIKDFAQKGLFADNPVDLGSRCTVFMNSSVKQAQKDGASIENISAGLSISVVKNALYKVIRTTNIEELGHHIVVQGGTFYNNAVLRAFEQELKLDVVRPDIAGIMGAYGAALYAKSKGSEKTLISLDELLSFEHQVKTIQCGLCNNHCSLTLNTFSQGRKFLSGNRCEKPISVKSKKPIINLYEYKRDALSKYFVSTGKRGKVGIPLGLNMYELLPFWFRFFNYLGFETIVSGFSNRDIYIKGQNTIPSDTVCFPAKLIHGHIEALLEQKPDFIFYPCMTYNLDEGLGDNHYNCPVVAYYPEVIRANMSEITPEDFFSSYLGLHRKKEFPMKFFNALKPYIPDLKESEVVKAVGAAFDEYHLYFDDIRAKGLEMINEARKNDMPIVVLAGRPYHVDPEINHGIDKMITSLGCAVVTEDVISPFVHKFKVAVLNQWTYHSRLYAAAKYITTTDDMNLVQLVSFGCGVDAITTDEVRSILEKGNKLYTQIKIDEITNLGAVKIRVRSMLAAIGRE